MHCINTDYSAFCCCEVATPTLYFIGGAKKILCTFWHSKFVKFVPYKCSIQMYIQLARAVHAVKFVSFEPALDRQHTKVTCSNHKL